MKTSSIALAICLFSFCFLMGQTQRNNTVTKVILTGKVRDKLAKSPLEYATVTFIPVNSQKKQKSWGVTDGLGNFSIELIPGNYSMSVEFISFKTIQLPEKTYTKNEDLGIINMESDATKLKEVTIKSEKSAVEIKLDKRIYNVSKDLTVKGGTASDVLDNVPSVAVDVEGNVTLRGSDNVRILINGRPINGNSISDVLRQIPADALDKIEVVTNPSARYDAEGGSGIINILLKQGKNQGVDGSISVNTGTPANHGFNSNINYKTAQFNLFNTLGYSYRNSPGNSTLSTQNFDSNRQPSNFIHEQHNNENWTKNFNYTVGTDWFLTKSLVWSNAVNYRKSTGENPELVNYTYYDANGNFTNVRNRTNEQTNESNSIEYTSAWVQKFAKDGHRLSFDAAFSSSLDNTRAQISDTQLGPQRTINNQNQSRNFAQLNYILPLGNNGQFEAGYKADYNRQLTQYQVDEFDGSNWIPNINFTNTVEYLEKINAAFLQAGNKYKKISFQAGIRFEDSNIDVNLLGTNSYTKKHYNNFFPSALVSYELANQNTISLSYSKRINRPRGRFLNPFSNYSSNISIFQGNPNLNPTLTDAIELTHLQKIGAVTLTSSAYYNFTQNSFQPVRTVKEILPDGTPVILTTPINLANEYRMGLDVTCNYAPYKWWKINGNVNVFRNEIKGDYNYTYFDPIQNQNVNIYQNLNFQTFSWFSRINSKITLPYGIDWQTNISYNAPQKNAQGTSKGVLSANLAFSKDLLKDRATLSLSVNDVFNTRKRLMIVDVPSTYSDIAMQWRVRQITLTFTYRFNKQKTDKERDKKPRTGGQDGNDADFPG